MDRLGVVLGRSFSEMPLAYALYAAPGSAQRACTGGPSAHARSCAMAGVAFSYLPFRDHELAHAVLLAQGLEGTAALQEGAAEIYGGCESSTIEPVTPAMPISLLVDEPAFHLEGLAGYAWAASFASFLVERHGDHAFGDLLARTRPGDSLEQLDAAGLAAFGVSIVELHDAWRTEPPRPFHRICRHVYACAAPPLEDAGAITLIRGVSDSIGRAGAARTFTVDVAGELHVRASAPAPEVRVVSCESQPFEMEVRSEGRALEGRAAIAPGRYALWLTGAVLEGADTEIQAELQWDIE